jgi:hypothetical protein
MLTALILHTAEPVYFRGFANRWQQNTQNILHTSDLYPVRYSYKNGWFREIAPHPTLQQEIYIRACEHSSILKLEKLFDNNVM